jgi:LysR family transcriptional regulator, glycine cleavage system transcriptional activator
MRPLPPLNSIKAFEVAARLGGVRLAAAELNVSQSAVSRHISNLEAFLQAELFERRGKKIVLTQTGREYLQQLEPALDAISRASQVAARHQPRRHLVVSAPPTFISNWIMPRLHRFLAQEPELDIRFLANLTMPEENEQIDCGIEYRFDPSPRLQSQILLRDENVVLASPAYISAYSIACLQDLRGCTLIETERRLVSWAEVLKPFAWAQKLISVSLSSHAFEAARHGLGVALANRHNATSLIADGALAVPFVLDTEGLAPTPRYFFSTSGNKPNLPKVQAFSDWLQREIAKNNSVS